MELYNYLPEIGVVKPWISVMHIIVAKFIPNMKSTHERSLIYQSYLGDW